MQLPIAEAASLWQKHLGCRHSTAVVQRFCKPKVGSSILSAGTSYLSQAGFGPLFLRLVRGGVGEGEDVDAGGAGLAEREGAGAGGGAGGVDVVDEEDFPA